MKKYKVMAYVLSSGLWDAFKHITLDKILGHKDEELEQDLAQWHSLYDDQFKKYPHDFDWDLFNEIGRSLTERIQEKLPPDHDAYYEPSDDREFFSADECRGTVDAKGERALVHLGFLQGDAK
jgi:hypothetical protein